MTAFWEIIERLQLGIDSSRTRHRHVNVRKLEAHDLDRASVGEMLRSFKLGRSGPARTPHKPHEESGSMPLPAYHSAG